jgi:hypothetical protein
MKSLFNKLVTQTAMTVVMLLMVFAPFASLTAEAQTKSVFDTGSAPVTNTGQTTQTGIGNASDQSTFSQSSNANIIQQSATAPISNTNTNFPASTQTTGLNSITAANGNIAGTPPTTSNNSGTGAGSTQPSTDILANCKNLIISGCIASMVYVFTVGIGSAFAYIAAYFFDITIQLSLNGASYGLDFVSTSWTTARDLANMAFLFILIYIAFTIILRADTSGTMSLLAGVIIVALLVNFSFFFSRVIIDAGNILTIQFYNAIPAPPISQTIQGAPVSGTVANGVSTVAGYAFSGDPTKTKDLTASIMNMIQVQNLLNNQSFAAANGGSSSGNSSFTFNLVSTIFIFIAAAIVLWLLTVAFITNGVKFLVRVVVLWFLIIVSPFAFVAAAVQGTSKGYFLQWRTLLITHAFYPVAFMFIFLILNNFAITLSGSNTNLVSGVFSTGAGLNTWSAIGASLVSVAIRVGLVIAVLFVGMRASDRISVYGATAAGKAGNWFGGKFIGAYGAVGRSTLGFGATRLGQSTVMQSWAARDSVVGRNLWRGLNKVGGASFDARATLKSVGVKDVTGANMGEVNKGGYKGSFDTRVKARETEAKKFSFSEVQKANNKEEQEKVKVQNAAAIESETKRVARIIDKEFGTTQTTLASNIAAATTAQQEAVKKEAEAAEKVAKMAQEVDDLTKQGKIGTPEMAAAITNRKAAETEQDARKATRQSFDTRIQDLDKERKKLLADVDKRSKAEIRVVTQAIPADLENVKNIYADSVGGKGPLGVLGNMTRLGAWIPRADKEAALKIKKEKTKEQKALEALKEFGDEGKPAEIKEDKKDDGH